ncbi:MAG: glutamate synthase-related protein [Acidobacteriota bacterium]
MSSLANPMFEIIRDPARCVECEVCVNQCANECHLIDPTDGTIYSDEQGCVGCIRCVNMCPTNALRIIPFRSKPRAHALWTDNALHEIYLQADTGGILLAGMGNNRDPRVYWDHLLLNASQVTNPSIDPLREPMEVKTFLGRKPSLKNKGDYKKEQFPQLELEVPIMFAAMSFGSVSLNVHKSLGKAAIAQNTYWNTGEGGLHPDVRIYKERAIVQVASGRFGVTPEYLEDAAAIEIKIGQGAKPGIGGHLPGEKVTEVVAKARNIPVGSDAISPAPHHDIYSIEDLSQLVYSLKEATGYTKPVSVKIAAVHNVAAIASGIARAGADILVIDGYRGGTGATPLRVRNEVGIPIEFALAAVDNRLRDEGIRHEVSIVCSGGIRNSTDVAKAIALGADAVYIGTSALVALGCHMCQNCYTGRCNWGIACQNPRLTRRLNPEIGARRAENLIKAWKHELQEILGGMGMNAVESLRGNRLMLRGIGLSDRELQILGVKAVGE